MKRRSLLLGLGGGLAAQCGAATPALRDLLFSAPPRNLLTFPENFENAAWTKQNVTVSADAIAAPNGTLTADLLTENATASVTHNLFQFNVAVSGGIPLTSAYYLFPNGRTKFWLVDNSGSSITLHDLSALTSSVVSGSVISHFTRAIGGGWYRIGRIATPASNVTTPLLRMLNAAGADTYTGDGTSGAYVWGETLNVGTQPIRYNGAPR